MYKFNNTIMNYFYIEATVFNKYVDKSLVLSFFKFEFFSEKSNI